MRQLITTPYEDWALIELPKEQRRPLRATVSDWISFSFFPIGLQTAVILSRNHSFKSFLLISFVGSMILAITSAASGYVAEKTGLTFGLLSRIIFGNKGYIIPCAIVPICLIGWDSFNLALQAEFTGTLFHIGKFYALMCFGYMLVFGIGAVLGFKWISRIGLIAAPAMSILLIYGVVLSIIHRHTFVGLWPSVTSKGAISTAEAITAVAGLFALGASVSSPDIQRFCKTGKDAVLTGVYAFGIAFPLHLLAGAICGLATGDSSISGAFAKLGAAIPGFILLSILSWTVVHNDYYCASLSLTSLLRVSRPVMAVIAGLLAALIAAANVQAHLVQWLTLMSTIAIPLAGVIVADYTFSRRLWLSKSRHVTPNDEVDSHLTFRYDSYISWVVGALTVYISNVHSLFVPPLNGMLASFIVQATLSSLHRGIFYRDKLAS